MTRLPLPTTRIMFAGIPQHCSLVAVPITAAKVSLPEHSSRIYGVALQAAREQVARKQMLRSLCGNHAWN
jgi:hypothetical protein